MARILVIDESQQRAVEICRGLILSGHQVAAVLPSAFELIERIEEIKPDIILIETESPSRDTLEHLAVMSRDMPRPVVMFSQDDNSDTIRSAIQAGVAAYVVEGFDIKRLRPIVDIAVAQFEEHQSLKRELAVTSRKLSERKIIEKAKGILMKQRGITESEAFQFVQRQAMNMRRTMKEIAEAILLSDGISKP